MSPEQKQRLAQLQIKELRSKQRVDILMMQSQEAKAKIQQETIMLTKQASCGTNKGREKSPRKKR